MNVAVVGAGAIGAFVGACLARGGTDTHLVARGANLKAIQQHGVRVSGAIGDFTVDVHATDDPRTIGHVDLVFLGLKAYSYADADDLLAPLLGPETAIVAAQNGIPWWYFHAHGGPFDGARLETVDPGGTVSRVIAPERVIGCVVYPATELTAPGVVHHIEGTRFSIGEPDRSTSQRCVGLSEALTAGGLKCRVVPDLRREIWVKLMGNAAFNPLSALTGATMTELCHFQPTRAVVAAIMEEIVSVAAALDCAPRVSVERRIEGADAVGEHKTSMLQDLEAGKRLELDVLVAAILELGDMVNIELPILRTVYATTALLERERREARA